MYRYRNEVQALGVEFEASFACLRSLPVLLEKGVVSRNRTELLFLYITAFHLT
jgi:hypothetical protein